MMGASRLINMPGQEGKYAAIDAELTQAGARGSALTGDGPEASYDGEIGEDVYTV
jgi:hypothetical protein